METGGRVAGLALEGGEITQGSKNEFLIKRNQYYAKSNPMIFPVYLLEFLITLYRTFSNRRRVVSESLTKKRKEANRLLSIRKQKWLLRKTRKVSSLRRTIKLTMKVL